LLSKKINQLFCPPNILSIHLHNKPYYSLAENIVLVFHRLLKENEKLGFQLMELSQVNQILYCFQQSKENHFSQGFVMEGENLNENIHARKKL
jgi:hypothetical protein